MAKNNNRVYPRISRRRQLKANKRRKLILKKRGQKLQGISKKDRKRLYEKEKSIKVVPPSNFSFIENTVECIKTFEKLYSCLQKKKNVFLQFKEIEKITDDTIVILMSVIKEFQINNLVLIGDEPKNKEVCKVFEKSGIANYVEGYITTRAVNDKNGIYSHSNYKVQNDLSHELIGKAAETIWGEKKSCPGVQRVLIECMANTFDHANPNKEASKSWWLSISHNETKRIVSFSFIDFGVGIFKNIDRNKLTDKFKAFFELIVGKYKNNVDVLKLILNGELKKSRTGLKNRGNGLPSIANAQKLNQIDNLKIISNDVFADLKNNEFKTLSKGFNGTFVYWEVNHNCTNKNWVQ